MSKEKIERQGSGDNEIVETDGKKTSGELDAEFTAEQGGERELPLTLKQSEELATLNFKDLAITMLLPQLEPLIKKGLSSKVTTEFKTKLKLTAEQSAIWDEEFSEWVAKKITQLVQKTL